ncbi:MAG: amidohydrolase family protein [Myxococcaceae bacterium]|nr:amidohydrolase family protein [Myxococcaceae bacterium]
MRQATRLCLAVLATGLLALTGCSGKDDSFCGDSLVEGAEQCDDGNTAAGDGCSSTCTQETQVQACGNGVREIEEACDDGNAQDGDGCESTCIRTPPPITPCASLPPLSSGATCEVTKAGTTSARLFQGVVLKDGAVLSGGQVLVDAEGIIQCAECDCSSRPEAAEATVVSCPQGVISPGLINAHDHITFQGPPRVSTEERYEHRHDWRRGNDGHTRVTNGGSGNDAIRWGELRQVLAGTTSVAGSGGQPGLLRNVDRDNVSATSANQQGLDEPPAYYQTFPLGDSGGGELTSGCGYPRIEPPSVIPSNSAYLPHIGEGIEESARNEFRCVTGASGGKELLKPQTAVIHGIAVTAEEIGTMASRGADLIWSPRSNISLYGDTAMVPAYKQMGVTIALGTDWLQSGSMSVLRELQCADYLNTTYYARAFTDEELWRMVTSSAADLTDTHEKLGRLEPGKVADLAIFRLRTFAATPHRAVLTANTEDVVLTLRGGKPLYGDQALVATLGQDGCEALDVCGAQKRVCVGDELGKTYAALKEANASAYPLFFCNQAPKDEPVCAPQRLSANAAFPASVNSSRPYSGARAPGDKDGDAVLDAQDNCPILFNPIRPMDNGVQADTDRDGVGDACDVCPLEANSTSCAVPSVDDEDGDGHKLLQDNCPHAANPDQADTDQDGRGDACDACRGANPGAALCATTIYDVKNAQGGLSTVGLSVSLADVLVTAVGGNGFFIQVHPSEVGRYQGPDFSGLFVFAGGAPDVAVGDRISITSAKVEDYFGQLELVDPAITKNSSDNPLPPLVVVSPAEVRTGGARAAALEGVLVELANVVVTGQESTYSEFFVDTTPGTDVATEGVRVNDYLYLASPLPAVGTKFRFVRGVLNFRNGDSKVEPRNAQDLVSPPPALTALGPAGQYVRVGQTGSESFPRAITVTMGGTYSEDVPVTIESNSAALRAGSNGIVVIPAGKSSAVVPLDPAAQAESVTLTASLEGSTQTTTVRVLGTIEQPLVVSITPTPAVTAAGRSVHFLVTLDRPAPADTVVELSVSPAGLGAVSPAPLLFPLNALQAGFTFTADPGTIEAGGTVTAMLGSSSASATVSLTSAPLPKLISMTPAGPLTMDPGTTQAFTLTLDAPALYDTRVVVWAETLTANATVGSVPVDVVIPKDATSTSFTFTAGTQNNVNGTVRAAFDGASFEAAVTVLTAPPVLTVISPATAQVTANRQKVFTVTVDRPAPEGGISVPVSLQPGELGTLSAGTVSIPEGMTSGSVTFTASASEATGQLLATWNGKTVQSDISIVPFATANHVVISEVAVGKDVATDEFVELYNPTNQDIDITHWKLQYRPGISGDFSNSFTIAPVAPDTTVTIKAHGYFLIAHVNYVGGPTPDRTYNSQLSLSGAANGGNVRIGPSTLTSAVDDPNTVDKLGYAGADAPEGTAVAGIPPPGSSYERKAGPDSTAASMAVGGVDELYGNAKDSDNNAADFVIRVTRQPQNSASATETP